MANDDTVKLLKECSMGVKTAVASIDEVLDHIQDERLKKILQRSKQEHEKIGDAIHCKLVALQNEDKEPNPMVKAASWMKINGKLMLHKEDQTVADLMTDGCNMGIKSLNKYLNEYSEADEEAKSEAKRIIRLEDTLIEEMKTYL